MSRLYTEEEIEEIRKEYREKHGTIYITCEVCKFSYEPWEYSECPICYRNTYVKLLKRNRVKRKRDA